jgi:hypothetical protein
MLLDDRLKAQLPGMGSSPETPLEELFVHLRFHDPANRWKWYVIEFDGEDTFFGLVVNPAGVVAGQFTLAELESLCFGEEARGVHKDAAFQPISVSDLAAIEPSIKEFLSERTPLTSLD